MYALHTKVLDSNKIISNTQTHTHAQTNMRYRCTHMYVTESDIILHISDRTAGNMAYRNTYKQKNTVLSLSLSNCMMAGAAIAQNTIE